MCIGQSCIKMKIHILCFTFYFIPVVVLGAGPPGPPGPSGPPGPPNKNFMESIEQCRNETKASQDEFFNVMRHELPKTKGEECMLACVQKKMGFLAADNKVNLDKILQSIEHMKNFNKDRYENLKKIYEDCKSAEIVEKDQCTAAKKFAECVYPKERALGPPPRPPMRPPPFNRNIEQCRNKTGATTIEVNNIMRHELPKTKNEQCMLACIQKKWEYIGEDNKINLEKIQYRYRMIKEHNPNMYNRTIQMYIDCKAIETTEKDECVAAKKYAECIFPKEKMNHLPPVMRRNVQECRTKSNASETEIYTSIISRDIPKTKGESCMLACMQKKSGAMNADNTMAISKMKNNFRNLRLYNEDLYNKSLQIVDDCKALEKKEDDECVAARKFSECIIPKQNELKQSMVVSYP